MSTTHPDNLKSSWFKQKYYIDGGYLKPAPGQTPTRYNPMSLYKPSTTDQRVTSSLHHLFANIDSSNESEIEKFYTTYGPLGLFEEDIVNLVAFSPDLEHIYPMPKESPIAGVQRFSNELMPISDLQRRYHIPEDKLPFAFKGESFIPSTEVSSRDTWESLEDFRKELVKFRRIVNLRIALADKDIKQIKILFSDRKLQDDLTDKELLLITSGQILWDINSAMENRVYPILDFDDVGYGISKSITWQCDSLLTALYAMVFLDISRGALMKRCGKCGVYFESMRPNTKYCSPSCQASAKSQRFRNK